MPSVDVEILLSFLDDLNSICNAILICKNKLRVGKGALEGEETISAIQDQAAALQRRFELKMALTLRMPCIRNIVHPRLDDFIVKVKTAFIRRQGVSDFSMPSIEEVETFVEEMRFNATSAPIIHLLVFGFSLLGKTHADAEKLIREKLK
ncbi:MAG: hypothetical protein PHR51_00170 [Patescibacteria group bacterium]|nr:hypothetical protein [Patescibacteria group bacterium]